MIENNKMLTKKVAIFILFVLVSIGIPSITVRAAITPYSSSGSETGNISVRDYTGQYNDLWVSIMDESVDSWNTLANVSIMKDPWSQNYILASQYLDEWYGIEIPTPSSGYITSFIIKLNTRTIADNATNFSNFAQSVLVHELGHVFWLKDNPGTTSSSIMKYSRNRNLMILPQQYDINNVNAKYD